MTGQLTLFETTPVAEAAVWETLTPEQRATVLSVLARLMARSVMELRDEHASTPEHAGE